ncbi:39S ribosomal protein L16 [Blattella germanica]|nr:39S ribosomal protein L16 [Blattella germanica]
MICSRRLLGECRSHLSVPYFVQTAGLKNFKPPPNFDHVEFPERSRLKFVDKLPTLPPNIRPPKMIKNLKFMRGPELVHNFLLHRQFGIVALGGGRLKWGHFEMIRMGVLRKIDQERMFAIWRIDPPWQPVTKKAIGNCALFGEKVTDSEQEGDSDEDNVPLCQREVYKEKYGTHWNKAVPPKNVRPCLEMIAHKLPFPALVVDQEMMEKRKEEKERKDRENMNRYTMKYIIQNNLGGCHNWISPYDKKWFGAYI